MIRPATKEDLEVILEIMNESILNATAIYEEEPWSKEKMESWFISRTEDRFPVVVLELNNQVIGYASYSRFRPRFCYRFTVEHSVYVHKAHRGKNYGAQLIQHIIEHAKSENYHSMIGVVDATNSGSVEFHKKYGFVEVGKIKEVGFKFDQWQDISILQLML